MGANTKQQGASGKAAASTTGESFVNLFWNGSMGQWASWGEGSQGGPNEVFIREEYVNGNNRNKYVFQFTATFAVHVVDSVARDKFYLFGVDSLGNGVVEKWEVAPVETPGIVTATDGTPPLFKAMNLLQSRLYTVPGLCVMRAFGVDLEERFIFIIHSPVSGAPNQLIRVPLPPNPGAISVVADSTTMPQLASAASIFPLTHNVIGRFWTIESFLSETPSSDRTVLIDSNNDGIIDSISTFDSDGYKNFYGGLNNLVVDGVSFF